MTLKRRMGGHLLFGLIFAVLSSNIFKIATGCGHPLIVWFDLFHNMRGLSMGGHLLFGLIYFTT